MCVTWTLMGYKLKYKCALSGHHVWLKYNNSGHIRDLWTALSENMVCSNYQICNLE